MDETEAKQAKTHRVKVDRLRWVSLRLILCAPWVPQPFVLRAFAVPAEKALFSVCRKMVYLYLNSITCPLLDQPDLEGIDCRRIFVNEYWLNE